MNDYKCLELKLLQLNDLIKSSLHYTYSDPKKDSFLENVINYHSLVKRADLSKMQLDEVKANFQAIELLYNYLTYLNYSTLNSIPFELVSCLEIALNDWVRKDDFIIVTILSNGSLDYFFSNDSKNFKLLNGFLSANYAITLDKRFIVVALPKLVKRDYLCNLALYHELGHFVEAEYQITFKLLLKKIGRDFVDNYPNYVRIHNHYKEHFADLFASMYVKDASLLHLGNIKPDIKNSADCNTHPSYANRAKVVNDFLNGNNNNVVSEIIDILGILNLPELKIRFKEIDLNSSNLSELVPHHINDDDELHYIFKIAWDIWDNSDSNFLNIFDKDDRYIVLNNLIEKSILNYIIRSKWNQV